MRLLSRYLLLAALAFSSSASAQFAFTTIYAPDNGGDIGGAVYFDLSVKSDMLIEAIEANLSAPGETAGGPGVQVYAISSSYEGNLDSSKPWALVAQGTANLDGAEGIGGQRFVIPLNTPWELPKGRYGIAIVGGTPNGIWVNTNTGNRLNKIDPGSSVSDFGANGEAQGIAVGVDGRVYSVSRSTDQLHIFDSNGNLLNTRSTADQPFGVAVGPTHVWVSCYSGALQRFSFDGTSRTTYTADQGSRDVAVDNLNQVWVASRWEDEVVRYDSNGVEQARVDVGDGPTFLEATPFGELLVVNHHDCTIDALCIKTDRVINSEGYGGNPSDLTVDTQGNIWISLYRINRIQFFDRLFEAVGGQMLFRFFEPTEHAVGRADGGSHRGLQLRLRGERRLDREEDGISSEHPHGLTWSWAFLDTKPEMPERSVRRPGRPGPARPALPCARICCGLLALSRDEC